MSASLKDFVFFRSSFPTGPYPNEARPLAESLSDRLRSRNVEVVDIQKWWDNLRLTCRLDGQTYDVEVTFYSEATPPEFSLHVVLRRGFFSRMWRADPSKIRPLLERLDQTLSSDPLFTDIRWYTSADAALRSNGAAHPF